MENAVEVIQVESTEVITQDQRDRALILDSRIKDSMLDMYTALAEMVDQKLYKAIGYPTAGDYFEALKISRTHAYRFAQIGRALKQLADGVPTSGHLAGLSTEVFATIISKASDQVERLALQGKIQIGEEELTAEQLKDATVKELRAKLKAAQQHVAENEILKKEVEIQNLKLERSEKELARLKEFEAEHSDRVKAQGLIMRDLTDAYARIEDAFRAITRAKDAILKRGDEKDDQVIRAKFVKVLEFNQHLLDVAAENAEYIAIVTPRD